MLTSFLNFIVRRLPWAFLLASGFAYLFYHNMNARIKPNNPDPPKSDSVSNVRTFADTTLNEDTTPLLQPLESATITTSRVLNLGSQNADANNGFEFVVNLESLLVAGAGVLILGYAFVDHRRRKKLAEIQRDKDPAELQDLFADHLDKIIAFETPRKLKRFSNRARFQYNLLKDAKKITSAEKAEFFFEAIIALETDRTIVALPYENFVDKIKDELSQESKLNYDNAILEKIYELNRNLLI